MTHLLVAARVHLRRAGAVLLLLAVAASPAWSAAETVRAHPDTVLGARVAEVVALINTGDPERLLQFVRERYGEEMMGGGMTPEGHAGFLEGLHTGKGPLDLCCFRISDRIPENMAVAIVHGERLDSWSSLQLRFDEAGKVTSFMIVPAKPPLDLVHLEKLDDAGLARELDAFLTSLESEDEFSGAVLVARDGKRLFAEAYGLAHREHGIPNQLQTRFSLGSMNKMFTAVAIAQLVEQGKLSFEDPISDHLPDGWLAPEIAHKVRIRQLLNHTSGLGDYLEGVLQQPLYRFEDLEDYKEIVSGETLQFEPGARWSYSNTGFFVLGVIVAEASGMDYYEYIRKHIYEPAGMVDSDHHDRTLPDAKRAAGYWKDEDGRWRSNSLLQTPRGTPAGGGYSTVADLLAFDGALRSNTLLSAKMRERLFSRDAKRNSPSYGYGFMIIGLSPDREVGHGGTYYGVSAQLSMFLDSGYTVVALSNGPNAGVAYSKALELIERTK